MGRTARLAGALLLVAVAASGCNQSPEVDYTIPANGAVGVAGDVEIAIAFTAPLDPDTATSAANFSVRVLGEEADRELSITLEEEDRVIRIVTAEPFGTAKTVEVVLGDGIRTSANYPVDSYAFSFTTAGVTADPDTIDDRTGRFVLQSLSAVGSPATSVVPPSPILAAIAEPSAEFLNGSIQSESVQLRGSLTGVRETLLQSGTPGSVTSAGFLIRAADGEPAFEPGEEITVILGSGLTAPANSLFEPPLSLRPHVTRFEALGGAVSVPAGFGDPISFAGEGLGRPREILFADLMPTVAPDLVVAEPGGGVQVHSRFGSGGYAPVAGFEGGLLRDIEAVDLEGFGETGLLTLLRSGEVEYSRLIGGLFFLDPDFSVPVSDDRVRDLETGDLDGDGRLDAVVAAGDRVEILHNDGESGGFVVEEGPLLPGVRDVELADLDGDGRLDLVSTDGTSIRILRGSGERTFLEVALFEEPVTIGALEVGPLGAGRAPDILFGRPGTIAALLNPESGSLSAGWELVTLAAAGEPRQLEVGDCNGDGLPDLLWYEDAPLPTAVLRCYGATFAEYSEKVFPLPPEAVEGGFALADTNRDGARDVVFHGGPSPEEGILLLAPTLGVVPATPPSFALSLEPVPGAGSGVARLRLAGVIPEPVERLELLLDLPPGFSLADGVFLEGDFVETSVGLAETPTAEGVHLILDFGQTPLTSAEASPIATIVLSCPGVAPGTYFAGLLSSGGGTGSGLSTVVELPDGRRLTPDLTDAVAPIELEDLAEEVPPVLAIECALDGSGTPIVSWSLPDDETITGVQVSSGGQVLANLPPTEAPFEDSGAGRLSYSVRVVREGSLSEPRSCTLPITSVSCARGIVLANGNQRIDLSWDSPGAYSSIEVRRDGTAIAFQPSSGQATSLGDAIDPASDCGVHVYSVVGATVDGESEEAFCVLPAVPGCDQLLSFDAFEVSAGGGGAELRWRNGQAYESIEVIRDGVLIAELSGTDAPSGFAITTSYLDPQLAPGSYSYQLVGRSGPLLVAGPLRTLAIEAPRPSFEACLVGADGASELSWTIEEGVIFDALELLRIDPTGTTVSLGSVLGQSAFTDPEAIEGVVTYLLSGLVSGVGVSSEPCSVERVDAIPGPGLVSVPGRSGLLPIQATLVEPIESFSLLLEYDPRGLEILAVRVGGETIPVPPLDTPAAVPAQLPIAGPGPGEAGATTIAEILFRTPESAPPEADGSLISILDPFAVRLSGEPISPTGGTGSLQLRPRGIYLDPASAAPGSLIEGYIRGTTNLEITGYELALGWDRERLVLESLEVAGAIGALSPAAVASTIDTLEGRAGLTVPPGAGVLGGGVDLPLAFYRFRVRDEAPSGATTIRLAAWSGGGAGYENEFYDFGTIGPPPTPFGTTFTITTEENPSGLPLTAPAAAAAGAGSLREIHGQGRRVRPSRAVGVRGLGALLPALSSPGPTVAAFEENPPRPALKRGEAVPPSPAGSALSDAPPIPSTLGARGLVRGVPELIPAAERTDAPRLTLLAVHPASAEACDPGRVLLKGSRLPPHLQVRFGGVPGEVVQVGTTGYTAVVVPPPARELPARWQESSPIPVTVLDPRTGELFTLRDGFRYSREFLRGDADVSGAIDGRDLLELRSILSGQGFPPRRADAADVNDDGRIGIDDLVALASFLHAGGPPPPAPFPWIGLDPTPDTLPGCPEAAISDR